MIAFLTQYLYGLGHSIRIRLIAASANQVNNEILIAGINVVFPVDKVFGLNV